MGAPAKRPQRLWIRANPRALTAEEIEMVRGGPHLGDLSMPKHVFRVLIWAGHRWARELAHVDPLMLRGLPGMDVRSYRSLLVALEGTAIDIGSKYRDRVHVPGT